jgi:hypothetical protein
MCVGTELGAGELCWIVSRMILVLGIDQVISIIILYAGKRERKREIEYKSFVEYLLEYLL